VGKSQSLAALASRDWFSDDIRYIGERSAAEQLSGKWLIELAELASVRKADSEKTKGWLTRGADRYRVPYGRLANDFPRQCIFCGSTNETEYLADATGARRYWPVEVSGQSVNVQALREERDQLWAEAIARYRAGEKRHPDGERENAIFAAEAEKRRVVDDFETAIRQWALKPWGWNNEPLSTRRLIEMLVGDSNPRPQDSNRMNCALFACGWTRAGGGVRLWIPPAGIAGVTSASVTVLETHAKTGLAH
jgi:predicted P-loop ATPase